LLTFANSKGVERLDTFRAQGETLR